MSNVGDQPARDRILSTAQRLFYRDGFHAVGVDMIIAEAGVAKTTLYRHFASKDDLIVAYLEQTNRQFWQWLDDATRQIDDPLEQLLAIFEEFERVSTSPECLGCTFQNTAAELPDLNHPGHQVALAHKVATRDRFAELATSGGIGDPNQLADQLLLLMDGAWAAARMFGPDNPSHCLSATAQSLVRSAP